jgi:hypothetical protein
VRSSTEAEWRERERLGKKTQSSNMHVITRDQRRSVRVQFSLSQTQTRPFLSHCRFALETMVDLNTRCVCCLACTCCDLNLTASSWIFLVRSVFATMMKLMTMMTPRYLELQSSSGPLKVLSEDYRLHEIRKNSVEASSG